MLVSPARYTAIVLCASIHAVDPQLVELVLVPTAGEELLEKVDSERAAAIRSSLVKYEHASRNRALLRTLGHTRVLIESPQSLNREVFDRDQQRLALVHRPDEGTPLKHWEDGERSIALGEAVALSIADYIDHGRKIRTGN